MCGCKRKIKNKLPTFHLQQFNILKIQPKMWQNKINITNNVLSTPEDIGHYAYVVWIFKSTNGDNVLGCLRSWTNIK